MRMKPSDDIPDHCSACRHVFTVCQHLRDCSPPIMPYSQPAPDSDDLLKGSVTLDSSTTHSKLNEHQVHNNSVYCNTCSGCFQLNYPQHDYPQHAYPPAWWTNTKSITTVFIVTLAAAVSWVPDAVRILVQDAVHISSDDDTFLDVLLVTNSWVNVLIYSLQNRSFRDALCH